MRLRFLMKESEISEILSLYGLLNEQNYSDGLIPGKGYQIIKEIEGTMGSAELDSNGLYIPKPTPYEPTIKETTIKNILEGFPKIKSRWDKIDPLFRTQIYSFMFQVGSEENINDAKNFRWLAALAQTIDGKIDRSLIYTDENYRKEAEKIVSDAIDNGTINSKYNDFKTKLTELYRALKRPKDSTYTPAEWEAIFELSWKNRPEIIDKMWDGKSIEDIKKEYFGWDPKKKTYKGIEIVKDETTGNYSKKSDETITTTQLPQKSQTQATTTNISQNKPSLPSTQTTGTKQGYREILPDGNTRVWDGPNNRWLPDADWMKLYNFDGTPKKVETTTTTSTPKTTGYTLEPDKKATRFTKF